MQNQYWISSTLLPILLVFVMMGLGLGLNKEDFTRVLKGPKPVVIGLTVQMFLLPLVAWAVCIAFGLSPEFSVGLMVLSASPGGVAANLFSHLCKGDVALNLTMTAVNSVLAAVWLPLVTGIALHQFMSSSQEIGMQFGETAKVFVLVVIPVLIGMLIKKKSATTAMKLEPMMRRVSLVFLVLIAAMVIVKEHAQMSGFFFELGPAVLVFNLASLACGYLLPKWLKLSKPQATAIAFEVGVHNSTLAVFVTLSILKSFPMVIPTAFYSVVMFITAGMLAAALKRSAA